MTFPPRLRTARTAFGRDSSYASSSPNFDTCSASARRNVFAHSRQYVIMSPTVSTMLSLPIISLITAPDSAEDAFSGVTIAYNPGNMLSRM